MGDMDKHVVSGDVGEVVERLRAQTWISTEKLGAELDRISTRAVAADWVEQQGGLSVVRDYPKMDEFVAALATDLDASDDVGCGDDLREAVKKVIDEYCKTLVKIGCMLGYESGDLPVLPELLLGELDKRLMPPGMTWPRWEDGKQLCEDDAPDGVTVVSLYLDGSGYGLADAILDHQDGKRVKRPESEVLGADGLPINVGETVHHFIAGSKYTVDKIIDGKLFFNGVPPFACNPSAYTHTPPDTQKRIDDDATLDPATYCDEVLGWGAEKIVHHSDYAAQNEAMIADLLRRQRELDAKTMGGE